MTQININYMLPAAASTGTEKSGSEAEAGPPGLFGELMGKKLGVKLGGQPSGSASGGKGDGKALEIKNGNAKGGKAKDGKAADGGIAPTAGAPDDGSPATTIMANAVPVPIVSTVWMGPDPQAMAPDFQAALPESVSDAAVETVPGTGAGESGGTAEGAAAGSRQSSGKPAIHWSWFQKGMPAPSLATQPAAQVLGTGASEGTAKNGDGTPGAGKSLPAGNGAAPAVAQGTGAGGAAMASAAQGTGAADAAAPAVAPGTGAGVAAVISAAQERGAGGTANRIMPAGQQGKAGDSVQAQASAPPVVSQEQTGTPAATPVSGRETAVVASQAVSGANAAATVAAESGVPVVTTGNTGKADGVSRVEAQSKRKAERPSVGAVSSGGNAKTIEIREPLQAVESVETNPQSDAKRSTAENRPGGTTASGVSQGAGEETATAELPAATGNAKTSAPVSAAGDPTARTHGQAEETISVQREEEGSSLIQNAKEESATHAKGLQKTSGEGKGRLAGQKGRTFKSALTAEETAVKNAPNGPAAGRAAGGEAPAIPAPTLETGAQKTAMESLGTAGGQPRHSATAPESVHRFDASLAAATSTAASPASHAAPAESARGLVMDRVMKLQELIDRFDRHAAAAAAEKDGSMTIKLIPDNLGKVSLNCREANGVLQMQVVVENQTVRNLLVQHETAIRQLLEQAGIQLSDFDVRTQQEGAGSRHLNGRGQGQNGSGGRQVGTVTAGEFEEAAPETPAYWSREQTQMWIA